MIESIRERVQVYAPDTGERIGEVERFTLKRDAGGGEAYVCMQEFPLGVVEHLGAEEIWHMVAQAWCEAIEHEEVR